MEEIRCSIEVRADESRQSPGRLYGVIMKYNTRAQDRAELFEPGALKWDASLLLNRQHDRASPIMRVTPIVVGDEVRIDQPLLDSAAGRSAAVEIRGGLMTGLSIEFKSLRETVSGGIRRISSALLGGVGLVDSPSYSAASVEVRAKHKRRQIWL